MSREFIHSFPPHGRRDGENATYHHLQAKRVGPKRIVYNYWGHIQEGRPEVSILGSAIAGRRALKVGLRGSIVVLSSDEGKRTTSLSALQISPMLKCHTVGPWKCMSMVGMLNLEAKGVPWG